MVGFRDWLPTGVAAGVVLAVAHDEVAEAQGAVAAREVIDAANSGDPNVGSSPTLNSVKAVLRVDSWSGEAVSS